MHFTRPFALKVMSVTWRVEQRGATRAGSSQGRHQIQTARKSLRPSQNNQRDEAYAVLTSEVAADPGALLVLCLYTRTPLGLSISVLSLNSLSSC